MPEDAPLSSSSTEKSPKEQQDILWHHIQQHHHQHHQSSSSSSSKNKKCKWPDYTDIMKDINNSDYNRVLTCPYDHQHPHSKTFCAYGTVCKVKIEMFPIPSNVTVPPYTGLLRPGQTIPHSLLRLSSAMKPPGKTMPPGFKNLLGKSLKNAQLFPMAALKTFRSKYHSGNLLFAGRKIGQPSTDFFRQSLCTQMTERVPTVWKPFVKNFYAYSENPLSLGCSDYCYSGVDAEVEDDDEVNFPYVVILHPVYDEARGGSGDTVETTTTTTNTEEVSKEDDFIVVPSHPSRDATTTTTTTNATSSSHNNPPTKNTPTQHHPPPHLDTFLQTLLSTPPHTPLFDIFACPSPSAALDPSRLQRIGRITSTSEMMLSDRTDGLFFRHQRKEDDFHFRPEWRREVKLSCTTLDGTVSGSVDRLVGATLMEDAIRKGVYVDFETG